jgi:hypothetical protein
VEKADEVEFAFVDLLLPVMIQRLAEKLGCSGGLVNKEELEELWCCEAELDVGNVNGRGGRSRNGSRGTLLPRACASPLLVQGLA